MTARSLIVIGGGEHARVVIEAARTAGWDIIGFVDPQACDETARRTGVGRLGGDDSGLARATDAAFVLGLGTIGTGDARRRLVEHYTAAGARFATIIHSHSWVSPTASLGDGAVVFAGSVVQSGAHLGAHVVVNTGAIVEHDVTLGDFAQLAPGVVIGGGTRVGEHCYLGLGCRVRDHVTLGARVVVAMGATVIDDVADDVTVFGVPARPR